MMDVFRQLVHRLVTPIAVTSWGTASIATAIAGPFGTYDLVPFAARLLYWALVIGAAIVIGTLSQLIAQRFFGPGKPLQVNIATCLLIVVGLTPALYAIAALLPGINTQPMPGFFTTALYVFAVTATVLFLHHVMRVISHHPKGQESAAQNMAVQVARLSRRLPDEFKHANILRLTVEDHFVHVVTDRGRTKLRMRFADAVNDMEPVKGYCTHRSHWVAHEAIAGIVRENGKPMVKLINGEVIPISRKYRPNLESAGFL